MPRLSHNKGKIRNKRRQRLHQRVAAKAPANEEAFDAQEYRVTVQDLDLCGAEPDELFTY